MRPHPEKGEGSRKQVLVGAREYTPNLIQRILHKKAEHKVGYGGIIYKGAFSWDTGFNSMARTPDDDANMLLGCSQKHRDAHTK